jgi:hypothetical protein
MKLIKIGEEFYLTNKQEVKIGDITLEKDNNGNYYMPAIDKKCQLNDNSGIVVIASTIILRKKIHLLDETPIKKLISGFDIEKLIECQYPKETTGDTSFLYLDGLKDGFNDGFFKSLELNSEKQFTYDDMVMIYNLGRDEKSKSQVMGQYYDTHKEWIGHITKQKSEWDVEIQMRSKNIDELRESKEGFLNNPNLYVPIVESGYINILKIK